MRLLYNGTPRIWRGFGAIVAAARRGGKPRWGEKLISSVGLDVGEAYELVLQGTRRWVRRVRIRSLSPDQVVVVLESGKEVEIPRSAVAQARRLSRTEFSGQQPGESPGTGSAADAQPAPADSAERYFLAHLSGRGAEFSARTLAGLREKLLAEDQSIPPSARVLHSSVVAALDAVAVQWLENDFDGHKHAYAKARHELKAADAAFELAMRSGQEPPGYIKALLLQLSTAIETERERYLRSAASSPDFVNLVDRERFYVGTDQTFLFAVSVRLPAGEAPVESLQLVIDNSSDVRAIGSAGFIQTLGPGESRELVQRVRVSDLALGVGETTIQLSLQYRRASGQTETTQVKRLRVLLEPERKFQPIGKNPYSQYSGGAPVQDQEMFFGRKDLLDRIYHEVTNGPLGQSFVLYGQKRSGKSSILRQLENRLHAPNLPIYLSLGAIDTSEAQRSFVQACIDALYDRLVFDFGMTEVRKRGGWPSDRQVASSPIESFRRAVLAATRLLQSIRSWREARPIFLIDEFTYVYEYIREGLLSPAFMRQWKSLLETGTFDAILVGQDTMPRFKNAYPNEFGVTHDERVSYLSAAEARALADRPIRMGSESRYKGAALDRVVELTAGSPFYLQIFCDQIVQYLNKNRHVFITEHLVEDVLEQLVTGPNALSMDKFDPLMTVAGDSVALDPKKAYVSLLLRLALDPEAMSRNPLPEDAPLVRDLIEREVLDRDSNGRLSIRVGLFAEWLRSNAVGIAE